MNRKRTLDNLLGVDPEPGIHVGRFCSAPCVINDLPVELLTEILHCVKRLDRMDDDFDLECDQPFYNHYPQLVCKRWQQACEPVLYRCIGLYDASREDPEYACDRRSLQWLYQKFIQQPRLATHVRDIYARIIEPTKETCDQMVSILSFCQGTTEFCLRAKRTIFLQPALDAAGHMPRLSSLNLQITENQHANFFPIPLQTIMNTFKACPLQKVDWTWFDGHDQSLEAEESIEHMFTSIKALRIHKPQASLKSLRALIHSEGG